MKDEWCPGCGLFNNCECTYAEPSTGNSDESLRQQFEDKFYPTATHMIWNEQANGYSQKAGWAALPTLLQNARWDAWQKAALIYNSSLT